MRIGAEVADPEHWWSAVAAMEANGALLVRPDQHVGFRARQGVGDPRVVLERALSAMTQTAVEVGCEAPHG